MSAIDGPRPFDPATQHLDDDDAPLSPGFARDDGSALDTAAAWSRGPCPALNIDAYLPAGDPADPYSPAFDADAALPFGAVTFDPDAALSLGAGLVFDPDAALPVPEAPANAPVDADAPLPLPDAGPRADWHAEIDAILRRAFPAGIR